MYPAGMKVLGDISKDGKSVELSTDATNILWRNVGDTTWKTLIAKLELKGADGANIELQKTSTAVQWRKVGDSTWTNLFTLAEVTGPSFTPTASVIASGGRPIGTAFTVNSTRNALVTYTLGYTLTATLALGQTVQVVASVDGAEVSRLSDGILLGLAGTLNRCEVMSFYVPAGKQVLFTKTGTAGIAVTVTSGQETLL